MFSLDKHSNKFEDFLLDHFDLNINFKERSSKIFGAFWIKNYSLFNKFYTEPKGKITTSFINNTLLSKNVALSTNTRFTGLNNNVLVLSNSVDECNNHFVIPNVINSNDSYIIIDSDAKIFKKCKDVLLKNNYNIQVLNFINNKFDFTLNPFLFFNTNKFYDIINFLNFLISYYEINSKIFRNEFYKKTSSQLLYLLFYGVSMLYTKKDLSVVLEILNNNIDSFLEKIKNKNIISKDARIIYIDEKEETKNHIKNICIEFLNTFINDSLGFISNIENENHLFPKQKQAIFIICENNNINISAQAFIYQLINYAYNIKNKINYKLFFNDFSYFNKILNLNEFFHRAICSNISCWIMVSNFSSKIQKIYNDDLMCIFWDCHTILYFSSKDDYIKNLMLIEIDSLRKCFEKHKGKRFFIKKTIWNILSTSYEI